MLPEPALAIIRAQDQIGDNPYVFAGRGDGPYRGLSQARRRSTQATAGHAGWTIHDLRRTARSLMSRAGVRADIAERVMGHAIAGVEGVYDRHAYRDEKADALAPARGADRRYCPSARQRHPDGETDKTSQGCLTMCVAVYVMCRDVS